MRDHPMLEPKEQAQVENSELDYPVEHLLTTRLLKLTNALNRQSSILLMEAAALRLPEWRCIKIIAERSGPAAKIGLQQIADILGMDRGTLSRAAHSLTEKGYILTDRDGTDRRVVYAKLTEKGQKAYRATMPVMQKRHTSLLNALSLEDREATYRVIDQLLAVLDNWDKNRSFD